MTPETLSVNGKSYRVLRLLGHGKGGYSYLVTDGEGQYTLKQIHHEPCSYYQFSDKLQSELNDYETLRRVGIPMPALLAADRENERILKEYIEGERIDELVLQDAMRPEYFAQIRAMCGLLYPAGLNIDYFPTNFIVRDGLLYYIDYECNGYMSQWDFENWGSKYWSKTEEFMKYAEEREHA